MKIPNREKVSRKPKSRKIKQNKKIIFRFLSKPKIFMIHNGWKTSLTQISKTGIKHSKLTKIKNHTCSMLFVRLYLVPSAS